MGLSLAAKCLAFHLRFKNVRLSSKLLVKPGPTQIWLLYQHSVNRKQPLLLPCGKEIIVSNNHITLRLCRHLSYYIYMPSSSCMCSLLSAVEGSTRCWRSCGSNSWPIEVNKDTFIILGHPGFWLCPEGTRATQAETFWEETYPCSRPHPGKNWMITTPFMGFTADLIPVCASDEKITSRLLSLSRVLGGFMLPTFPGQIWCILGIFTSRL